MEPKTNKLLTLAIITMLASMAYLSLMKISIVPATSLFTFTFESGDFSEFTGSQIDGATVTFILNSTVHHGSYSTKFNGTAQAGWNYFYYKTLTSPPTTIYMREYVLVTSTSFLTSAGDYLPLFGFSNPTTGRIVMPVIAKNSSSNHVWGLYYRNSSAWFLNYSSVEITTGWHSFKLKHVTSTGANLDGEEHIYVDDAEILTLTNISNNDRTLEQAIIGGYFANAATFNVNIDCGEVSDVDIGDEGPQATNIDSSTTGAGISCDFSAFWSSSPANMSYYIFETNNTGVSTNDTATAFPVGESTSWSNITKTLIATVGATVSWRILANNTAGLWGTTGLQYIVTTAPITITINDPETDVYTDQSVPVDIEATPLVGSIDKIWYNIKNGSVWVFTINQTYVAPTTVEGISDGSYHFYVWANNTGGMVATGDLWFSAYYLANEGTIFGVNFEGDESFQISNIGDDHYYIYSDDFTVAHDGYPPYWSRGAYGFTVTPTGTLGFEPDTSIVHSGAQSAKLSLTNPTQEAYRRIEILRDWPSTTTEYIWEIGYYYIPSSIYPLDAWVAFHRIAYERMWDPTKAVTFQQFQISLSMCTDGRAATNGQQIFVLDLGKGDVDNNDDGVEETWLHKEEDLYSNTGSSDGTIPASWLTQSLGFQVPFDQWFQVKTLLYRNLTVNNDASYNSGYLKVWIDNTLIWDVQGTRTIGVSPPIMDAINHVETGDTVGYFCNAIGLYTDLGSDPKTIYVDDVLMSSNETEPAPETPPSELVLPSVSVSWVWQYLYAGDFVGFFNALFITTFNSLSIGIALVVMLFLVPLYIRSKSLMLLIVAWILLGGFLIVAMPEVSGLAIIFMALGIGGLFWRLFRPSS